MFRIVRPLFFICICLSFLGLGTPSFAQQPKEIIAERSEEIIQLANKATSLQEFQIQIQKTIPIEQLIDFRGMTQRSVGHPWRTASEAQREELIEEFRTLIFNVYSSSMFQFKKATITIKGERIDGTEAKVRTTISYLSENKKQGATVDYVLEQKQDSWKIVDVTIESISLSLSYKNQFQTIISQSGISGLISQLKEKNAKNAKVK